MTSLLVHILGPNTLESFSSYTMASQQNGVSNGGAANGFTVKAGLAQMLKGGVIMDVVNAEQVWSCIEPCTLDSF